MFIQILVIIHQSIRKLTLQLEVKQKVKNFQNFRIRIVSGLKQLLINVSTVSVVSAASSREQN